ncbi:taurine ABC transporter ATP-binding protein [Heyndrickxia coagulans]|nr:taurine ABC transporter ATP-binding protein [Heyndrickxia coagulans]KXT19589.1 taurine ABC transporter ATP-binding protein [Heyndrickxia coagulans]
MPASARKMIEVKDLSLRYGAREMNILEHINLDIYENDFVCILGPSGCGKTSLLNVIAGFQTPDSGEVIIDGIRHAKPGPDVGVVFQQPNLFPWLSIENNIAFGLKMKKMVKKERKQFIAHYLQLTGLEAAAKKLPYQLSGGMKQRAAIARTLATNPKVILMDEPFSALDALTRASMQNHLLQIWRKEKKCILFITHDVEEALLLGTRIILMKPNPGSLSADFANPLFRPENRSIEEIKTDRDFHQWSARLLTDIRSFKKLTKK